MLHSLKEPLLPRDNEWGDEEAEMSGAFKPSEQCRGRRGSELNFQGLADAFERFVEQNASPRLTFRICLARWIKLRDGRPVDHLDPAANKPSAKLRAVMKESFEKAIVKSHRPNKGSTR